MDPRVTVVVLVLLACSFMTASVRSPSGLSIGSLLIVLAYFVAKNGMDQAP